MFSLKTHKICKSFKIDLKVAATEFYLKIAFLSYLSQCCGPREGVVLTGILRSD